MQTNPRAFVIAPSRRQVGLLGLGSVAVILTGMLVAALPYRGFAGEGYSPLSHFISELGEIAVSRMAWAFNLGLVVGGMGLGLFMLLVSSEVRGRFRPILLVTGAVATASGALVGVFPMDYHATHRLVSSAFFLTGWSVAAVFTAWVLRTANSGFPRWLARPGVIVTAVTLVFAAVYSTYNPVDPDARIIGRPDVWSVALLEWATLLALLGWFACLAIVMVRTRD